MKTVLLSSTSQWNVGDEFIREGVKNLLDEASPEPLQFALYDRNPDRLALAQGHGCRRRVGQLGTKGNSWHHERLEGIDYVVICGTPSWTSNEHRHLFEAVRRERVPIIFLGLGYDHDFAFNTLDKAVLRDALLVTCRDKGAASLIASQTDGDAPEVLPCPAALAAPKRGWGEGVAVVWQTAAVQNQNISDRLSLAVLELAKTHGLPVICHYIHEFLCARRLGLEALYSHDWRDYITNIYPRFEAVISTRLHGAILATGLGLRAVNVNPSARAVSALAEFPAIATTAASSALAVLEGAGGLARPLASDSPTLRRAYIDRLAPVLPA